MPPSSQDHNEQINLRLAESAKTMASTDFWKLLVQAMANYEANSLIRLDNYLTETEHPDREEVITLCLKWHESRMYRRLLLSNVRDYKALTIPEPLSEEASEIAREILSEYGEM